MARATKAEKAQLVNAAYRLLGQRTETAEAERRLADEFDVSVRQAYRYLEQAAALSAPVPVVEPTVAVTFKLPVSIVYALRAYARRSGLTLGQILTQALAPFLGAWHRRRGFSDTRTAVPFTFSSTTPSIDCGRPSWPTRTGFWSRREHARLRPR